MRNKLMKDAPFAVLHDGIITLFNSDGKEVRMNFTIKVIDTVGEIPTYEMTGACNIAGSIEEMNQMIKELNDNKPID